MTHRWIMAAVCLMSSALAITTAQAGSVQIPGIGGSFSVPVKSRQEMRWDTVVRQQYDYSCGSAAIATLLTYHYDLPTHEKDVFQAMFAKGNQEKIRAEGFSLLDMKLYLDNLGLRSDGFKITLDKLEEIGVPGIALVNTQGYRHFVVIKGIKGDKVIVGDPAAGTTVVPRALFENIWNGVVLAARGKTQIAKEYFNAAQDWKILPQAPVAHGVNRTGLGMFTLNLPRFNEFGSN